MKKYKCIKNKPSVYQSTGGLDVKIDPKCEYSIYYDKLLICNIGDHFTNNRGVGEGICEALNKSKILLPL